MSGQLTVTLATLSGGGKKYSPRTQSSRRVREGQQVAVNLEKERVIIYLEESSMNVCGSPGCTELSQGGRRKSLKHFSTPQRGESTLQVQNVNLSCIRRGAQRPHMLYVVLSELWYPKYRRQEAAGSGEAVLNGGQSLCWKILTILYRKIFFTLPFLC